MNDRPNNPKPQIRVPVIIDLDQEHLVFQQPTSKFTSRDSSKLESLNLDPNSKTFHAVYKPNLSGFQNSMDIEKHSIEMKGTEVPLRNHVFAVKKTQNGYKLVAVKSLVSYAQVYENESKTHTRTKLDQIKDKLHSNNKLINLRIE